MKPDPEQNMRAGGQTPEPASGAHRNDESVDPVLKVSLAIFALATLVLGGLGVFAFATGRVQVYLHAVGLIYLILSIFFLVVVAVAFVYGHIASPQEIEAPKLELFEMEERE